MPLTPEEEQFVKDQFQAFQKTAQLNAITAARKAEEEALVQEYKVAEVNTKRAAINEKYQAQISQLQNEILELKTPAAVAEAKPE